MHTCEESISKNALWAVIISTSQWQMEVTLGLFTATRFLYTSFSCIINKHIFHKRKEVYFQTVSYILFNLFTI